MDAAIVRTVKLPELQEAGAAASILKDIEAHREFVDVTDNGTVVARIVPIFRDLRDGIMDEILSENYTPRVTGFALLHEFLFDPRGHVKDNRGSITVNDDYRLLVRIDPVGAPA